MRPLKVVTVCGIEFVRGDKKMKLLLVILAIIFSCNNALCKDLASSTRSRIIKNIYYRNYEAAKENNASNSEIENLITKYSQVYWNIHDYAMTHCDNSEVPMGSELYKIIKFTPTSAKDHEGIIVFINNGKKFSLTTSNKKSKMVLNAMVEYTMDTDNATNYLIIGIHNLFDKSGDRDYGIYILENTPHDQAPIILDYYRKHFKHKTIP